MICTSKILPKKLTKRSKRLPFLQSKQLCDFSHGSVACVASRDKVSPPKPRLLSLKSTHFQFHIFLNPILRAIRSLTIVRFDSSEALWRKSNMQWKCELFQHKNGSEGSVYNFIRKQNRNILIYNLHIFHSKSYPYEALNQCHRICGLADHRQWFSKHRCEMCGSNQSNCGRIN